MFWIAKKSLPRTGLSFLRPPVCYVHYGESVDFENYHYFEKTVKENWNIIVDKSFP